MISPPAFEYIVDLDLTSLGHGLGARGVLSHHEILNSEHDYDQQEEQLGLVLSEYIPRIDEVS